MRCNHTDKCPHTCVWFGLLLWSFAPESSSRIRNWCLWSIPFILVPVLMPGKAFRTPYFLCSILLHLKLFMCDICSYCRGVSHVHGIIVYFRLSSWTRKYLFRFILYCIEGNDDMFVCEGAVMLAAHSSFPSAKTYVFFRASLWAFVMNSSWFVVLWLVRCAVGSVSTECLHAITIAHDCVTDNIRLPVCVLATSFPRWAAVTA